jgi:MFS family permease
VSSELTIASPTAAAGPLKQREFRLFLAGQAISLLGDAVAPVALAFAVLATTGSSTDVGYVFAARLVPLLALLLVGGVLADRLPRRRVMIVADLLRFASQGATAALLLSGQATLWQLLALQAVHGSASALFDPAIIGMTALTVPSAALQQANAYCAIAMAGAQIAGPLLAAALVVIADPGWALAVDALSFAVSAMFLAALRPPHHAPARHRSFLKQMRDGWTEFSSRSWVWSVVALAALVNALWAALLVLGPAISDASLGGPEAWGIILGAFGIGSALGAVIALRWTPSRPLRVGIALTSLLALPEMLLALRVSTPIIAGGALAAGAGTTIFSALWQTTLQRKIPAAALARVSAYDWLGSLALRPVGLAATGMIAAAVGSRQTLLGAAAISLLAIACTLAIRDVRDLRF